MRKRTSPPLALLLPILLVLRTEASQAQTGQVITRLRTFQQARTVPVTAWRFRQPDIPQGETINLDESDWKRVQTGYSWPGANSNAWFRTRITIPDMVGGLPTKDLPVRLRIGMDDDGEIYVDGQLREKFHWDDGNILLTEYAQPGQTFVVAIRNINGAADGQLRFCNLIYGLPRAWQTQFSNLLQEMTFLNQLAARNDVSQHAQIAHALQQSTALINFDAFYAREDAPVLAFLTAARAKLLPLQPLTRKYKVTYVGHSHIDMNWLWTWPETIDICQRTWDSAMKLMNQFPDFGFVQSQPGAYVPIQQQFPAEFARMQQASRRGQWDVVGGLWNESDTDLPSGEGLARSLFLGQRYFKQYFGRYAETGWLPDSFGHSWQIPQLYQSVGIRNFYHQRGGDGARFSWWQSPDGSRILKANTDHYDANIDPDQLTEPWDNARRYDLKQSLVVYGVGDHGGGPTREQILKGKSFQESTLLPQVQFQTADAFFRQLRAEPVARTLPIVNSDLQYVAMGCYTTHADIKTAVRESENDLYTAESLASIAAMQGRPYPVQGFSEAWKPTTFAQFHDIMCGSAIHSTYTWMHEQLAPARRFTAAQIGQTLSTLTAAADTRGGKKGDPAVVVWNPLSSTRDDVVQVTVPNARRFKSVYDAAGRRYPVQAKDEQTLVFVALQTPGFGHAVYFLSTVPAAPTPAMVQTTDDSYVLENPFTRLVVAKETGLMTELLHKATGWQMLSPGQPGNLLQVLGDGPSAWDIHFTGDDTPLTTQGAKISLLESGPVYSVIQVEHTYRASRFVQRITFYNQLSRIDVPTEVAWHEHEKMLKVAFPLNIEHPDCRVGIPYGSIARPHNGQENPGQKWMDVTEMSPDALRSATPLDISALFNHDSGGDFDTEGRGYPRDLAPNPGTRRVGRLQVPIQFAASAPGEPDNVACDGQSVKLPAGVTGNTLFLLGAGAPGAQETAVTFVQKDGTRIMQHVRLNDWILEDVQSNESIVNFPYQLTGQGRRQNTVSKPHLWLTSISIPEGSTRVFFPENRKMHVFAATLGQVTPGSPQFGLSVLNNSKYGSDTTGGVFRLSLLRSSKDPDPNPDEGTHSFTYSLWPHKGDSRAGSEQAGLTLNISLRGVVTSQHPPRGTANRTPFVKLATQDGRNNLVAGALKHSEDGSGYILRFFETQGRNTTALLTFSQPVKVEETDLLERPLAKQRWKASGRTVRLPVGHDKIVTLHITGLPDAGARRLSQRKIARK